MHYKNGTPAKVGDLVVAPTYQPGARTLGTLVSTSASSTTCNGQVAPFATVVDLPNEAHLVLPAQPGLHTVTIGECMPLEIPPLK